MPNVVVYVPAADWRALEEAGFEVGPWVRGRVAVELARVRLGSYKAGTVVRESADLSDDLTSGGEPIGVGSASSGEETRAVASKSVGAAPPKSPPVQNRRSEPFSLVCSARADHKPGVYCPECKGGKR